MSLDSNSITPVVPDSETTERLLAECYGELRAAARRTLNGNAARLSVQPTELLHEASIRLMRSDNLAWHDRQHFVAMAARVMRQVLVDELRSHRAVKRGGGQPAITLRTEDGAEHNVLALDAALHRLRSLSEEKARIVELRVFGGMTVDEIAYVLDRSPATIKRGWRAARAWLYDAVQGVQDAGGNGGAGA